ncbi:MAG: bis(5'-nucleosyl)-tetraphosphatase (symmetrical) YqeK [Candidatus Sumerlaeia bacterium]
MEAFRLDDIYDALNERLSDPRIMHVLGSGQAAVRLARRWDVDADDALTAALLHDIAKELKPSELRRLMDSSPEWATEEDGHYPSIWHAVAGAIIATREFGVSEKVARAILYHPTGSPDMDRLAKVIFLADYIEPTRTWEGVAPMRRLAMEDLEEAVRSSVIKKTDHVQSKSKPLHPRSLRTRTMVQKNGMEDAI